MASPTRMTVDELLGRRGEHTGELSWRQFKQREAAAITWHVDTYETDDGRPQAGPVLVTRIAGTPDQLADGHHRLAAAEQLGQTDMPVVYLDV